MDKKQPFGERILGSFGYCKRSSIRSTISNDDRAELKQLIRKAIAEEMSSSKELESLGLEAVARTVTQLTPELSMNYKSVQDILDPGYSKDKVNELQGEELNRQLLVEVTDLRWLIKSLEEAIITYDNHRREDDKHQSELIARVIGGEIIRKEEELRLILDEKIGESKDGTKAWLKKILLKDNLMKWIPFGILLAMNFILTLMIYAHYM
jgi:hypothetical protein